MLKELTVTDNSFIANGNKYLIHSSLSIGRMGWFEKFQAKLQTGLAIYEIPKRLEEIIALKNAQKGVQADHKLMTLFEATHSTTVDTTNPALLLCSLFVCREDEDLAAWNEAKAMEAIEDWKTEGYDFKSFFALAFSLAVTYLTELTKGLVQDAA